MKSSTQYAIQFIALVVLIVSIIQAQDFLLPIAFAILLAGVCSPTVKWLEGKGIRTIVSVTIVLVGIIVFVVAVGWLISGQMMAIWDELPQLKERGTKLQDWIQSYLKENYGIQKAQQSKMIREQLDKLIRLATETLFLTTGFILKTALTFIYTFVLLVFRRHLHQTLSLSLQQFDPEKIDEVLIRLETLVQQYISGLFRVALLVWICLYLGLWLAGIQHALLFATLGALFNLIPYLGILLIALIASTYHGINEYSLVATALVLGVFWGVHLIESNILSPMIVGSRVSMNAMAALFAVIVGGVLWGPAGMFLSLPYAAALKVICEEIPSLRPIALFLTSKPIIDATDETPPPSSVPSNESSNRMN
ncbi:MAG: AI-2E family transporter, partial [Bacteroidia bacterium]|nr:AI-2E family transporter [Bacteroidia bacterium]